MYVLAASGVSYICLRHATALVSMRHRLAELTRLDPLTRCLNRRGFHERLEQAFADAVAAGGPVTLIVADLDRFKEVNDTYGHQAGDGLLAWTGRTIMDGVRPVDAVGRIGGDEFAAVLPGVGPDEAEVVAGRLRAALDGVAPASVGHASYPADAPELDRLRILADERTYVDKVGRDRRPPTAEAVSRAGAQGGPRATTSVPRRERRGRSIVNLGLLTTSDCAVGLLYTLLFADGRPHRTLIGVLCGVGAAYGTAVIATADRLRRSPVVGQFMLANALLLFCFAVGVVMVNGGVGTATGLALLIPMPLIALGAPIRVGIPVLAVVGGAYVAVGLWLGAPSTWFVVMHLVGVIIVCIPCAVLGRTSARQRRLLTRLSKQDALTGCLNRRGFDERFTAELPLALRGDHVLSLLILDLDGFKQLNDSAGHPAGDDLLRWVAGTLQATAGPDALVGRLGGDEFVVVRRSSSADDSRSAAERLRAAIAPRTPASVGTAVSGRDGDDLQTLYAHADAELYAEKAARTGTARRTRLHRSSGVDGPDRQRRAPGPIPARLGHRPPGH